MSVVYRSAVCDMSVNCRWHIGQLSVTYQSCFNLAGEYSGFPFERLSNVIMLLGKMLQCEVRLLYEANRRALRTKGMVIFSFVLIVSSISEVLVNYRSSICEASVTRKAMSADMHLDRLSLLTDYRLSINRVSINCRSTVDQVAIEYLSSVDRYVDRYYG